ncbi:hypothetical protein [Methyloceanibacter sp.]|uniref:hypothetical protein n=1 Tax=Methyloceanibacter sp. TaxID=1965321 RepID=UPI002CCA779D|nr:hypothetical protein [Methyloceanibacter sp.]HML92078.1 hypothetical protein [Methyloceanibacter sp.]
MRKFAFLTLWLALSVLAGPALGQLSGINAMTPAATFDGQPINAALAQQLAGDRTLIAWKNCSLKLADDGSVHHPGVVQQLSDIDRGRRVVPRATEDVPCIQVVTGRGTTLNQYFVFETPCPATSSGSEHACMGGYLVGQRIKSTVTDVPGEAAFDLEFIQEYRLPMAGAGVRGGATATSPVGPPQTVGTAKSKYALGRTGSYSVHQAYDAEGNPIGDAFSVSTANPIAYSDTNGQDPAQEACVDHFVGELIQNFDAQYAMASVIFNGLSAVGAAGAGVLSTVLVEDPRGFGVAGIALAATKVSHDGMSWLHGTRKAALRAAAQQYCEKYGLPDVGGTMPADPILPDLPMPPSKSPPNPPPAENMEWMCVRWKETTATYYENQSDADNEQNSIGQDVEVECLEHAYVAVQ